MTTARKYGLNNFQRKKTAEWLLNISQAILVGTLIGFFIPGIGAQVGILGVVFGTLFSLGLYILAMQILKEVENDE